MTSKPEPSREFLVALVAWSSQHVWIEADSEKSAEERARELWGEDENAFAYKDGGIDGVTVLESRERRSGHSEPDG
jgi:hypothetical protein